jgi:hypothetical protein
MTNRKLWLCVVVGALLGAAGVQAAYEIRDRNSRERFEQRLRCKALADKYVKVRSSTVILSHVEFSRSRSSCIASTFEQLGLDAARETQLGLGASTEHTNAFTVVDLLTGEELMTRMCTSRKVSIGSEPECSASVAKQQEMFNESQ